MLAETVADTDGQTLRILKYKIYRSRSSVLPLPLTRDLFATVKLLVVLKPNSIMLAGSELAPNMFGASSELASVIEFGF